MSTRLQGLHAAQAAGDLVVTLLRRGRGVDRFESAKCDYVCILNSQVDVIGGKSIICAEFRVFKAEFILRNHFLTNIDMDGTTNNRKTCWAFTVNNPEGWHPLWQPTEMAYLCYELEHQADEHWGIPQGTPHIQGYVRFKTRKTFSAAKHMICNECHLEFAKGTEAHNREYCSKEKNGSFKEFGTYEPTQGAKRQGQRSDLEVAINKMKTGVPRMQVFQEHPDLVIKYPGGMEKAVEVLQGPPPAQRPIHNTVLFGETGTGKSHRAHMAFPDAYVATVGVGTFDKYSGEDVIILDEFEPSLVPIQELLQWLDKWKCQVKCRYSNKWARWTHVIIISNVEPRLWYSMEHPPQREALRRRLDYPMGQVFEVKTQEQEIDMTWWLDKSAPAAPVSILGVPNAVGSSTALPAPVPMSQARTAGKRTSRPSPTSSPSGEPLLRRPRTSGEDSQSADGSQQAPIDIDEL